MGLKNKEERKAYTKKYREEHKEETKEYNKKYREEHFEELKIRDKLRHKLWYEKNKEKKIEKDKLYYQNHKEERKAYSKKYELKNKDKRKKRYEENKEYMLARHKKYRDCNKEILYAKNKIYREEHKEQIKEQKRKKYIEQRADNVLIKWFLKSKIRFIFEEKEQILGLSKEDFIKFIESKWKEGMSWDNHGSWHIDHIRPCASFDLSKIEDIKICFHYTNAQPLWAHENMRKGKNKVVGNE